MALITSGCAQDAHGMFLLPKHDILRQLVEKLELKVRQRHAGMLEEW